jgi:hypothetical protein
MQEVSAMTTAVRVSQKLVGKLKYTAKLTSALLGVYVHKFKLQTVQYLMADQFVNEDLESVMIGPHENYYRDLKSDLKAR